MSFIRHTSILDVESQESSSSSKSSRIEDNPLLQDVNYLLANKEEILNRQLENAHQMLARIKTKFFDEFFEKAKMTKLSEINEEFKDKINQYEKSAQKAVNELSKQAWSPN